VTLRRTSGPVRHRCPGNLAVKALRPAVRRGDGGRPAGAGSVADLRGRSRGDLLSPPHPLRCCSAPPRWPVTGSPGRAWAGSGVCHPHLPAIDPLVTGSAGDCARYPPVLHRLDIAAAHGRPTQEARPDSQAAYDDEVIAMTAERGPVLARSGWALTALRRAIGVLHHLQEENMRASEALFRPVGAPRPRPRADVSAGSAGAAASATEPAERVS
jgi:hypothetical protein